MKQKRGFGQSPIQLKVCKVRMDCTAYRVGRKGSFPPSTKLLLQETVLFKSLALKRGRLGR